MGTGPKHLFAEPGDRDDRDSKEETPVLRVDNVDPDGILTPEQMVEMEKMIDYIFDAETIVAANTALKRSTTPMATDPKTDST